MKVRLNKSRCTSLSALPLLAVLVILQVCVVGCAELKPYMSRLNWSLGYQVQDTNSVILPVPGASTF